MNLEYLKGFIVTAEEKSISKASEKLTLSHPALSKQIKQIEAYFNTPLFNRTTSGVELTKAGELVYEKFQTILREMTSLEMSIKKIKEADSYRIGTLPSLAGNFLPQKILKLKEMGKHIQVIVKPTSIELVELLKSEKIDGAILEELHLHNSLRSKKLFEEPFYLILPKNHSLANQAAIKLEEVKDETFVLHPPTCSIRQRLNTLLHSLGYALNVGTEVEFSEYLIGYVAAGAGITVVPEMTARHVDTSRVKAIPLMEPRACRTISLITHSKMTENVLFNFFRVPSKKRTT